MAGEPEILAVGYEILVEVKIDAATGAVLEVLAFPTDFNATEPVHVYSNDRDYLPAEDDDYRRAVEIADGVHVNGDIAIPFEMKGHPHV